MSNSILKIIYNSKFKRTEIQTDNAILYITDTARQDKYYLERLIKKCEGFLSKEESQELRSFLNREKGEEDG